MEPIRLTLLKKIQSVFKAVTDDATVTDGTFYGIKFSVVGIGALTDTDFTKRYSIGIVVGEENLPTTTGTRDPILNVDVEFRQTINKNENMPGEAAEILLAKVQQIIMDNDTLDGLAINFSEVGNEIDLTTYNDKSVRGVVRCQMQYRQRINSVYPL